MSSTDQRQISTPVEQQSDALHQYSPVTDQLPFPRSAYDEIFFTSVDAHATTPPPISAPLVKNPTTPLPAETSPNVTRKLNDYMPSTNTGALSSTAFPPLVRTTTTTLRQPVVIQGSTTKSKGVRPPKGRRMVVNVAATVLLMLILLTTLTIVIPVDSSGKSGFSLFQPMVSFVKSNNSNIGLVAQQAATATAVTQDGFDPGGGKVYPGVPTAPTTGNPANSGNPAPGSSANSGNPTTGSPANVGSPDSSGSTLNRFFYGQCTYWANYRYHQLTGHWVVWLGNADEWAYGAESYGWTVSTMPTVPSIIVLMPGVQGAGPYGHVAVVESINADGSVNTSNFNWQGNWGTETWVQFRPGPGTYFVSYP